MNLLNCIYQAGDVSVPVAYALVRKPIPFCDRQTRPLKGKSEVTKNQLLRPMLRICQHNRLRYRYVLADSWFSAKENRSFIRQDLKKHFIVALKSNRTVALSPQDKAQGRFVRIDRLDWSDPTPVNASIKGLHFSAQAGMRLKGQQHTTGPLFFHRL